MRFTALLLLVLLMISVNTSIAEETQRDSSTPEQINVAVRISPPFAMQDANGKWSGIAIDVWNSLAAQQNLQYTFIPSSVPELLEGVSQKRFYAGVGAISVTSQREESVDFTHPYFKTGLGIAVQQQTQSTLVRVLYGLISWSFLKVIIALLILLGAVGIAVWWCERKKNPEQFGGSIGQGIGAGLWWSAVTMTTVGYGDKSPQTFAGRSLGLLWMFASIIVISSFTAGIASSLTVDGLQSRIQNLSDLERASVGCIEGTTGASFANEKGLQTRLFANTDEALTALAENRIDAVIHDRPILQYGCRQHDRLWVLADSFQPQDYAIVLPRGSKLRKVFNKHLLELLATPEWEHIKLRYLGP